MEFPATVVNLKLLAVRNVRVTYVRARQAVSVASKLHLQSRILDINSRSVYEKLLCAFCTNRKRKLHKRVKVASFTAIHQNIPVLLNSENDRGHFSLKFCAPLLYSLESN
jgi:hypothetical protein